MPTPQRLSIRSRLIGNALRKLREERRLTVRIVVAGLARSVGWLSAIENGLQPIHPDDLKALLDYYEVPEGHFRTSLKHLAARSRQNWQRVREGRINSASLELASLEGDAAHIWTYEPSVIPGLLQTPDYTRALIEDGLPTTQPDIDELVAFRQTRQAVLFKPDAAQYVPVIAEAVLLQHVGTPALMAAQLRQILDVAERDNIDLRILPLAAGARLWMAGSFDVIELKPPGESTVVVLAGVTEISFIEQDVKVRGHQRIFAHLLAGTLSKSESFALIDRIASSL